MITDPKTLWNSKLKMLRCFSSLCDYDYFIFFCACSSVAVMWLHMREPEINLSVCDQWLHKPLWELTCYDNSNFDKIIASAALPCHLAVSSERLWGAFLPCLFTWTTLFCSGRVCNLPPGKVLVMQEEDCLQV